VSSPSAARIAASALSDYSLACSEQPQREEDAEVLDRGGAHRETTIDTPAPVVEKAVPVLSAPTKARYMARVGTPASVGKYDRPVARKKLKPLAT
jgi:hypothetical protein